MLRHPQSTIVTLSGIIICRSLVRHHACVSTNPEVTATVTITEINNDSNTATAPKLPLVMQCMTQLTRSQWRTTKYENISGQTH